MNIRNPKNFVTRSENVDRYLKEINKYTVMTSQEEKDKFAQIESSKERLQKAIKKYGEVGPEISAIREKEENLQTNIRNEIVLRNQRFVYAAAKMFATDETVMDFVNIANMGMFQAFAEYDYTKGVKFCSYAQNFVRRAIYAYLVKENLTVRSTNAIVIAPKAKKIENEFYLKNGRMPSGPELIEELDKRYGIKVKSELDIYGAKMEYIDSSVAEDEDLTFGSTAEFNSRTASTNGAMEDAECESVSESTKAMLASLSERERKCVMMSFGIGYDKEYTNHEIGQELGLTSERVRQIIRDSKEKMKAAYFEAQ